MIFKFSTLVAVVALFVAHTPAFSQKIKEKNDVIHVDGEPKFKIHKTYGKGIVQLRRWAVVSMQGDTLIRLDGTAVKMPKLPDERGEVLHELYIIRFQGDEREYGMPYSYGPGFTPYLARELVEDKVIVGDTLSRNGAAIFARRYVLETRKLRLFRKTAPVRDSLLADEKYVNYRKGLKARTVIGCKLPFSLKIAFGSISYNNLGETVLLGNIKNSKDEMTRWIYRAGTNELVAILKSEKGNPVTTVVTEWDKRERHINSQAERYDLDDFVALLLLWGYL